MAILIISTSSNEHANAVETRLVRERNDIFRLNLDQVSGGKYLLTLEANGPSTLIDNEKELRNCLISSVFVHHPKTATVSSAASDGLDLQLHISAWRNTIDWLEQSFATAVWFNAPRQMRSSASPTLQLRLAKNVGLRVPHTTFTNNLQDVLELAEKHKRIIVKSGPLLGTAINEQRILTQVIDPTALSATDLHSSPCLFQEYIEKAFELRVHVIGQKVLTCKIDSQRTEATKIDWRNYALADTPHTPIDISHELSKQCLEIVKTLGLSFGIMDFIVTPEGEVVFLECNSQGHWLWIEQLTGLPITTTLCDSLVDCND